MGGTGCYSCPLVLCNVLWEALYCVLVGEMGQSNGPGVRPLAPTVSTSSIVMGYIVTPEAGKISPVYRG